MAAFSVESPGHADRIVRTEIGTRLEGVPLKVLDDERSSGEADDGDETNSDEGDDGETDSDETKRGETDGDEGGDGRTTNARGDRAGESGASADAEAGASGDEKDAESEGDEKDDGESEDEDENREETDDLLPECEETVGENRRRARLAGWSEPQKDGVSVGFYRGLFGRRLRVE